MPCAGASLVGFTSAVCLHCSAVAAELFFLRCGLCAELFLVTVGLWQLVLLLQLKSFL